MLMKIMLPVLLLLVGFLNLAAQTPNVADTKIAPDADQLRRQTFEKVWTTVNENHFDPSFGGVNWQKVREIYEPQARAAKTDDELYGILRRMFGELKLSHFGIYPPLAEMQKMESGGGSIGVELKMIAGQAVINRVEKNSNAERAGLKPGFVIENIDGKTTEELLAPLEKILPERTADENVKQIYREKRLAGFINGKAAANVKIGVLDGENKAQEFDVERIAAHSEMSPAFGNLPPQPIEFEAKNLGAGVGYIRFNIWMIPQMPRIRQAVRDFAGAQGIVFDLRGNPGGVGGMASGVAGLLVKDEISLGSMHSRGGEQKFIAYPQTNPFTGKIVILSDYGTGSTSEVFAAGMQDAGRAKVIGERSAGAVLPSLFVSLPTGAIFQYPIADYKSPRSVLVEGRGV